MNLKEQTYRIKKMMGLNESSKKRELIKKLIDNAIDDLKHMCEQNDEDNIYIDPEDCELIESDIKVQINNISDVQGKMYIELVVNYENYHHYSDEESLEWEIYGQLKKWIPNCAIKIIEMINNYPEDQRQW